MVRLFAIFVLSLAALHCAKAQEHGLSAEPLSASPTPGLAVKWRIVETRMAQDAARLANCRADPEACSLADKQLDRIIDGGRARAGLARIGEINRAINLAIRPMSDMRRFGIADLWSSPLDTLEAGSGDCEDYAILKFFALREAGFAAHTLRLVLVRDVMSHIDHAVLSVQWDGRWLVLDNRSFALADLGSLLQQRYRFLAALTPGEAAMDYASAAVPPALPFM